MTLKVVMEEPKILKNILEAIPLNTSERVLLAFGDGGLQLHAAIQGNVWAVEAFMKKAMFATYELSDDYSVQLNLKDLADFIKTASAGDSLSINLAMEKGSMDLTLQRKKMKRAIELRLLGEDAAYKFLNIVALEQKLQGGSLVLSNSVFSDAIKNVELGGGHVEVSMTSSVLNFTSKGTTRTAETAIDYEYEEVSNTKPPVADVSSTFSIDYLRNISKFSRIQDQLLLCFGDKKPALAVYQFDDELGYVAIAIAPKSTSE